MGKIQIQLERNVFLDGVKVFTMFLVIWGHVVQQIDPMFVWTNTKNIYTIIYTVHMPLFMGICGFLYYGSIKRAKGIQEYINVKLNKRLKTLILPMVAFGIIQTIVKAYMFKESLHIGLLLKNIHDIWFLGDLAINSVIFIFVLKYSRENESKKYIYQLIGFIFSAVPLVGYGGQGFFMYLSFVIGYNIAKNNYAQKLYDIKKCFFASIIYFVSLYIYELFKFNKMGFSFDLNKYHIGDICMNSLLKVVMAFTGVMVLLSLLYKCYKTMKAVIDKKIIIDVSKNIMHIYLLNIIILETIAGNLYRKIYVGGGEYLLTGCLLKTVMITMIIAMIFYIILLITDNMILKIPKVSSMLFYK